MDGVLAASPGVWDPLPNPHFIACFLGPLPAPTVTVQSLRKFGVQDVY